MDKLKSVFQKNSTSVSLDYMYNIAVIQVRYYSLVVVITGLLYFIVFNPGYYTNMLIGRPILLSELNNAIVTGSLSKLAFEIIVLYEMANVIIFILRSKYKEDHTLKEIFISVWGKIVGIIVLIINIRHDKVLTAEGIFIIICFWGLLKNVVRKIVKVFEISTVSFGRVYKIREIREEELTVKSK